MEELAHALVPKCLKVVAAVVTGFVGSVLLGLWLLEMLIKARVL
jgi:hypothetical protein